MSSTIGIRKMPFTLTLSRSTGRGDQIEIAPIRRSHAQMLVDDFGAEVFGISLRNNTAAVHHVKAIAELAHKIQILLDENDRHILLRDQFSQHMADLLN